MNAPTSPAARNARAISTSPSSIPSASAMTTPGSAAHAPAVGMATITPIELFTSISAVT